MLQIVAKHGACLPVGFTVKPGVGNPWPPRRVLGLRSHRHAGADRGRCSAASIALFLVIPASLTAFLYEW